MLSMPQTPTTPSAPFDKRIPTASHILSAPLPQLLDELGATLVESDLNDDRFLGGVVERHGHIALLMPPGRSETERDLIARSLLGNILGVDLSPLPAPLRTETARLQAEAITDVHEYAATAPNPGRRAQLLALADRAQAALATEAHA